jgi:CheY-like chemotaxis protein
MATVLVVDDEPAIRAFVREALQQAGHRVLEAADGAGALRLVEREHPDLVLLDVALPQMSGVGVCRLLHERPATAFTPVLLLTGLPDQGPHDTAAAGAQGYLAKPFSPDLLISQADDALLLAPVRQIRTPQGPP